jgi:lipopolysaccharide heptosyltransferase II
MSWASVKRILCVRLDSLGDVLMTTPAIRALRESIGASHITLLTSASGAAVVPYVPEIDEALVFAAPWMKTASPGSDRELIARIAGRFDAAVIFTVYSQSALPAAYLCHLAGIPLRLAHCRENPYHLLTDWVPDPEPAIARHEVERQLALVAAVGCATTDRRLSFAVPQDARRQLRRFGLKGSYVVVHPGASAPSRRYPPEGFAAAMDLLVASCGSRVVFTGDASEVPLVEGIRGAMAAPSRSLAGALSLPELAALIDEADLLVSNNTGPAHLAAALGTPVVDLYALTNPQHTPWLVESRVLFHDVPCRNCYRSVCPQGHHDCLRRVEPERVARAASELLHR